MGIKKAPISLVSKAVAGVLGVALSASLVACGAQSSSTSSTSAQTQSTAQEQSKEDAKDKTATPAVIGEKGSDALKTKVTNALDKDISSFKIRKAGDKDWAELLKEGEVIKAKSTVELGIAPGEKDLSFDVLVKYADNSQAEVDALKIGTLSLIALNVENGVGFATFTDADGKEGTTRQDEAAKQDEVAKAEEAKGAPSDEASQSVGPAAQSSEPAVNVESSDDGNAGAQNDQVPQVLYEEYTPEPVVYTEPAPQQDYVAPQEPAPQQEDAPQQQQAPAQDADGCLSDVVLR